IAEKRQVIAITHLPQLASMADVNYLIEKTVTDGKTLTYVKELTGDAIYFELMRLAGAIENSAVGLSSAKELKQWATSYKTRK
ncbi:MAG TPA: DNA repair protein RecN, partial [Clostridia bacterium]|nr:DNA repair protein RecN [Clostridia bacterium]